MAGGRELLRDAARDEWSDPIFTARAAVQGLLDLAEEDWTGQGLAAARELREARRDSPLLLAVTEAALREGSPERAAERLRLLEGTLEDRTWTTDLGLKVAHHASLGVLSLATDVLRVLEAAAGLGESGAELYTDRRAIARGLGYLRLHVEVAPPEEAEALLLPAVAVYGQTVWTEARAVDIALAASVRGKPVISVVHPLAHLSPANREVFRPVPGCGELKLPR